jgi:hypothetical protein
MTVRVAASIGTSSVADRSAGSSQTSASVGAPAVAAGAADGDGAGDGDSGTSDGSGDVAGPQAATTTKTETHDARRERDTTRAYRDRLASSVDGRGQIEPEVVGEGTPDG